MEQKSPYGYLGNESRATASSLFAARAESIAIDAGTREPLRRAGWILCALCSMQTYFAIAAAIPPHRALTLSSSIDRSIPLVPAWAYVYGAIYAVALVPVFIARDLRVLRRIALGFFTINLIAALVFLGFPTRMERPPLSWAPAGSFTQWTMGLIYALDPPVNCFPSLHVANAFFVGTLGRSFDRKAGRWLFTLASLIAVSTLLIKQHYLIDVMAGALLGTMAGKLVIPRGGWPEHVELPASSRWLWIPGLYAIHLMIAIAVYAGGWRPAQVWVH